MVAGRVWVAVVALLSAPAIVRAQQNRPNVDVAAAIADLQSNELPRMERAIPVLATSGNRAAVGPLVQLLRRGPPGPLLVPILEALGALARPEAQDALIEALRHHRAAARARAAGALATMRSPRVSRALVAALGDDDEAVRSQAARSLATAGMRDAVEPLLAAFERGNDAAAAAIGTFGDAGDIAKLLERIGRMPLALLLPAFGRYLARRDVAEAAKIPLVDQLTGLSTVEVKRFLQAVEGQVPPGQRRLLEHIRQSAAGIPG